MLDGPTCGFASKRNGSENPKAYFNQVNLEKNDLCTTAIMSTLHRDRWLRVRHGDTKDGKRLQKKPESHGWDPPTPQLFNYSTLSSNAVNDRWTMRRLCGARARRWSCFCKSSRASPQRTVYGWQASTGLGKEKVLPNVHSDLAWSAGLRQKPISVYSGNGYPNLTSRPTAGKAQTNSFSKQR